MICNQAMDDVIDGMMLTAKVPYGDLKLVRLWAYDNFAAFDLLVKAKFELRAQYSHTPFECVYCKTRKQDIGTVATAQGVRGGHAKCVLEAYQQQRLLPGIIGHPRQDHRAAMRSDVAAMKSEAAEKMKSHFVGLNKTIPPHLDSEVDRYLRCHGIVGSVHYDRLKSWASSHHSDFFRLVQVKAEFSTAFGLNGFTCSVCHNREVHNLDSQVIVRRGPRFGWGHTDCILATLQTEKPSEVNMEEQDIDVEALLSRPTLMRAKVVAPWARQHPQEFSALVENGFNFMLSSFSRAACPYCHQMYHISSVISGQTGILWGHVGCVSEALSSGKLYLSRVGHLHRADLYKKTVPYPKHDKKMLEEKYEYDAAAGPRPERAPSLRAGGAHCPHCPDVLVERLELPASAQPMCTSVVSEPGFQELLEKVWQDLIKKRFSHYLRTTNSLPMCPVHQSQKIYMTLENRAVSGSRHTRELWLVCPGDQKQ